MRYFDASALVKRYVYEPGSAMVGRLLNSDSSAISRLSEVEVASALARRVREGALTWRAFDRIVTAFERDIAALLVVELTEEVTGMARQMLRRHTLRAGDAIQLASCLYLQAQLQRSVPLVAFDARLAEAARREGLDARPMS